MAAGESTGMIPWSAAMPVRVAARLVAVGVDRISECSGVVATETSVPGCDVRNGNLTA